MATPTKIEVNAAIEEAVSAQGSSNELKKLGEKPSLCSVIAMKYLLVQEYPCWFLKQE